MPQTAEKCQIVLVLLSAHAKSVGVYRVQDFCISRLKAVEGPRDLEKYKINSEYWKKRPLLKLLDFVKVVRNIDIFNLEPKTIKCFFANVF